MNLTQISDQSLLSETKRLTQCERKITAQILHHLREVERRRLFSDCGCSSLFDYAVKNCSTQKGKLAVASEPCALSRTCLKSKPRLPVAP